MLVIINKFLLVKKENNKNSMQLLITLFLLFSSKFRLLIIMVIGEDIQGTEDFELMKNMEENEGNVK